MPPHQSSAFIHDFYPACRRCGTTKKEHKDRGLCSTCYNLSIHGRRHAKKFQAMSPEDKKAEMDRIRRVHDPVKGREKWARGKAGWWRHRADVVAHARRLSEYALSLVYKVREQQKHIKRLELEIQRLSAEKEPDCTHR